MLKYLLAILVVVVIIILVDSFLSKDKNLRKKCNKLLETSTGGFDNNARSALNALNQIGNPTPADYFQRAGILRFNLINDNIDNFPTEIVDTIAVNYQNALMGIDEDEIPELDFMFDRIIDFQNILTAADYETNAAIEFNLVANRIPAAKHQSVQNRVKESIANSNSKKEAVETALDSATRYTSDKQNVHDSKVNNDLREALSIFKRGTNAVPVGNEVREWINNVYASDPNNLHKVQNAITALNKVEEGNHIFTFNETESNILSYVWQRCKHQNNIENRDLMFEAVVNSLADSVENGGLVCINGRCSRMLNSLATLDFDKKISERGALTFEAYKNQIYQETKNIVNEAVEEAKSSDDSLMRDIGKSYDGNDIELDETTENMFKKNLIERIDANLAKYSDKLSPAEINTLKDECHIYASI